jgi:hypothetical protein
MNDLETTDASDANKHAAIVVVTLGLVSAVVVSEMMIDPAAAKFGSVAVFHNSQGQFVCGGVNGKNRMGAYSGEVRFISRVGISSATLDPQVTTTASDAEQARLSCNEMKASEYATQSTIDSICTTASEYERNLAQQALFENEWNSQCM